MDLLRPGWTVWQEDGKAKNTNLPFEQPHEVADSGILLGDLDDARDVELLRRRGAGAVLNLCPEMMGKDDDLPGRLEAAGITYRQMHAVDTYSFDIVSEVLPGACDYIEAELKKGHKVLVNCWGGVNRSTSVIVGFLALRRGMPVAEAAAAASLVRGLVLTNRHFRRLLVRAAVSSKRSTGKIHHFFEHFGLCCKRRRIDAASQPLVEPAVVDADAVALATTARVRRVAVGAGHVVHGLCFEMEGGQRTGLFLNNDRSTVDMSDNAALVRRDAAWTELDPGEFVAKVSGHRSWMGFLAAELVLHLNSGREIRFRGPEEAFERNCGAPFAFAAAEGHAILEAFFDRTRGRCTGILEAAVPEDLKQAAAALALEPPSEVQADALSHATDGERPGRVRRIAAGCGHAVHGLCFELDDGSRLGTFLEEELREDDGSRKQVALDDSEALERRGAEWHELGDNEYIVEAAGHRNWRGYLAADVVLRTSEGRELVFRGKEKAFARACGAPFRHAAQPGHEIVELHFDLARSTCSGILESSLAGAS